MPDLLSAINVTTRRYIRERPKLTDGIYNKDPLMAMLRSVLRTDWTGGSSINENFLYAPQIGGGYLKGKIFNTTQRQVEQQARFDIKLMEVGVPLQAEDIMVFNKGPLAAASLMETRIDNAYMSAGQFAAIALYLNGQTGNYIANLNGLAEMVGNATDQSWDGTAYSSYGSLTRASYPGMSSPTLLNVNGVSLEFDALENQYQLVNYGSGEFEPNLIMTTPRGLGFIRSRLQTQQRFQEITMNTTIGVGFKGLSYNSATILSSRMCPGSFATANAGAGTQDPVIQQYLAETIAPGTNYPVGNLATTGGKYPESLFILNARQPYLNYYVSNDSMFGGGFRDFVWEVAGTSMVGFVLLAHQVTGLPRMHTSIYNFTS